MSPFPEALGTDPPRSRPLPTADRVPATSGPAPSDSGPIHLAKKAETEQDGSESSIISLPWGPGFGQSPWGAEVCRPAEPSAIDSGDDANSQSFVTLMSLGKV